MKWRHLGHLQLISRAKHPLSAMAQKEVCPRDETAGPPVTNVLPIDRYDFAEGCVSFRTLWCVIGGGEICAESCDCMGSATVGSRHREIFPVSGLRSPELVLKLDDQTLLHLIAKSMVKESRWR